MLLGGDEGVAWSSIDLRKYVLYGGLFTVAVDAAIYPMEVLKTRVQVDTKASPTVFRATFSALQTGLRTEGIGGLYRGFWLYTLGGLPSQGAYFLSYSWAKERLAKANGSRNEAQRFPDAVVHLAAGFFADVVAAPLWTPTDVIMQRLQIQGPGVIKYEGVGHAFSHIVKYEGIRGLFRGLGASIVTFGPASALWWAIYEGAAACLLDFRRRRYAHPVDSTSLGHSDTNDSNVPWVHGTAGFIAGAASSMLTNPLDIAKTRLQTQHSMIREYQAASVAHLHAALRGRLERDRTATKARRLQFFQDLRDARDRERERDAAKDRDGHRARRHEHARAAVTTVQHAAKASQRAAPAGGARNVIVLRAAAAAAAAVGAVHTAADTLRADVEHLGTMLKIRAKAFAAHHPKLIDALGERDHEARAKPAPSQTAVTVDQKPGVAAASTPSEPHQRPVAVGKGSALPLISAVPYQSSIGRDPVAIEAAASSARAAIVGAESERIGRHRRAPNAAALAAAASRDARALAKFYPEIGPRMPTNIFSMVTHIVRTEGIAALVRGMFPRIMLHGPASAATFVCYEQVLRLSRIDPAASSENDPLR